MQKDSEKLFEAFKKDPRIACQYGEKCYQKNPAHHERYKHPPSIAKKTEAKKNSAKRKINSRNGSTKKLAKTDETTKVTGRHNESSSSSSDDEETSVVKPKNIIEESPEEDSDSSSSDSEIVPGTPERKKASADEKIVKKPSPQKTTKVPDESASCLTPEGKLIAELFLVKMPDDFYKFYEFCCLLSKEKPTLALKAVDLELVGPFDVLAGKIGTPKVDRDVYLRHWRYFYDPPEFQTILKGNVKDALHYGYWRDDPNKMPVFVGKNSANKDCKILTAGPNIFSAVSRHIDEASVRADLFSKPKIAKLSKALKDFAAKFSISLDKTSPEINERNRKLVTKTFHGAGIVVPYDTKTQLGYRDLAITDHEFRKILNVIKESPTEARKKEQLCTIDDVVRYATIAADECDFGTPLELGHDLFSSGLECMEKTALRMLNMSYSLLQRPQFSKIAQAHLNNRKQSSDLSVL